MATMWFLVDVALLLHGVLYAVAVAQTPTPTPTLTQTLSFRECMVTRSDVSAASIVYLPGEDGYRERMGWAFQPDPSDALPSLMLEMRQIFNQRFYVPVN